MRRLTAAAAFFLSLSALAQQPAPTPLDAREREAALAGAIAKLNEAYVFPETAAKMEAALRARIARGEYASISDPRQFADKLTADLREVSNDKHLGVYYAPEGASDEPVDGPTGEDLERALEFMTRVNFGFEKAERLSGNVGLVEIRGFVPPEYGGEIASAAMTLVANTDALIIDLRRNGGGEPSMIAWVTSYLFDRPTHLNDIVERAGNKTQQWWTSSFVPGRRFGGTKPVFVLTSGNTFSGGEEFAYNLKNLKRATIVGETTGGGAHPVRGYKISEHFALGVPYARAVSPITKGNWEGTGVIPDVALPADQAFEAAYTLALEKVLASSTNPMQQRQLRQMLEERKKK
jgi:hypothetical protein